MVNCCWIGAGALWQGPDTATTTTVLVVRIPVSPHSMDPGTKAAMNSLDAVTTFALGGVGDAGAPNEGQTIALRRATSLANDAELVDTMSGCLAYRASVGSIAARMQDPDDGVGAELPRP